MLGIKLFKILVNDEYCVTDKNGFWYCCKNEAEADHMVLDIVDKDSLDASRIVPGVSIAH